MKLTPDHFRKRAAEHHARINSLYESILSGIERSDAQEMAKEIKSEIEIDMDWARADRRRRTLSSEEESAISAIWQAGCHLGFKTNSDPKKSRWDSALYDAVIDLEEFARD